MGKIVIKTCKTFKHKELEHIMDYCMGQYDHMSFNTFAYYLPEIHDLQDTVVDEYYVPFKTFFIGSPDLPKLLQ